MTGLVISSRLWSFIEWPLIALGTAYVLALCSAIFFWGVGFFAAGVSFRACDSAAVSG